MTDKIREFEAWWESDGKYCRAGGGDYERTFAYEAWQAASAALAQQPAPAAPAAQEPVIGWAFHNPDTGWEWHEDHPVESGMAEDATGMRQMSLEQFRQQYGYADAAAPAAEQPDASAQLASIAAMCQMIEDREWAEHVGVGEVGRRVESALTALHNELLEAQRQAAAEQPDTVRVPPRLLDQLRDACIDAGASATLAKLNALLDEEGQCHE